MQPERLGPYRIVRTLGHGGMGTVYEGVNLETEEPAAVKILSAALAHEQDFRQRFEAEIEALRMLRHPNIVRLFGFGEQDSVLYYAMELVDGHSLEQELRGGRRFHWREVAQITIEMCRALRHAHDRGIVHRDIKPANLLLASNGQVKLSDFGIARLFGNSRLTAAGNVLGTVEYMAPEQADARPVGPRSDLYSLGGVMYALLAGRAPFKAKSLLEMLDKQRTATPDPVSQHAPDVPAELEQIVAQLLAKDPDARIPNAMLLARRLEAMVHALSREPESQEPSAPPANGGVTEEIKPPAKEPAEKAIANDAEKPLAPTIDRLAPTLDAPMNEFIGLPSTRALGATFPKPVEDDPLGFSLADGLAETKETSAFQEFAAPPPAKADVTSVGTGETKTVNRFVSVHEDDLDRHEEQEEPRALISLHTWVLAAALMMTGLTAWYLLRPPTADALYDKIEAKTADRTVRSYESVEPYIRDFLSRYSSDPRSMKMREYMKEIELRRLERQFELRIKGLLSTGTLLPVQSDYLEALNYARLSPELGIAKFQALIDFYQQRGDASDTTGQCLELARRQIAQLQEQLQRASPDHLAMVEARLDKADSLAATDPELAQRIRQAVIELYDGKPWAAGVVQRAKEGTKGGKGMTKDR